MLPAVTPRVIALSLLIAGSVATLAQARAATPNWLPPINPNAHAGAVTVEHGSATPAAAAASGPRRPVRAVIADDEIHAPYVDATIPSCVQYNGSCNPTFTTVPAGHRRLVSHVSCIVTGYAGARLRSVVLLDTDYTLPREYLTFTSMPEDYPTWIVDSATQLTFEAGRTPMVYVFLEGTPHDDVLCTVTGRDIAL